MRSFICFFHHSTAYSFSDGKSIASTYDCKYAETSGVLNHNVDELLVGILKQIRLKLAEKNRFSSFGSGSGGSGKRKMLRTGGLPVLGHRVKSPESRRKSAGIRVKGILGKMLRGDSKSKSCDDLYVL